MNYINGKINHKLKFDKTYDNHIDKDIINYYRCEICGIIIARDVDARSGFEKNEYISNRNFDYLEGMSCSEIVLASIL